METDRIMRGGCFCGAVCFELTLPIKSVINCHCTMCRSLSGAAYTTWASAPIEGFHYLEGEHDLAAYEVSANVTKHFCRICGTAVTYQDIRYPEIFGIPAGTIRDPIGQPPSGHYFVSDKASWIQICDGLPQFGGMSGFDPMPS